MDQTTPEPTQQPEPEPVAQPEVAQPEAQNAPVEPVQAQPAKQEDPRQVFLDGYKKLCTDTGFTFSVEPKLKQNPDGSYDTTTVSIQTTVVPEGK